jgi:hypothetical protein
LEFGAWNLFGHWCLEFGILIFGRGNLVLGNYLVIGIWCLEFIWLLVLGIWNFSIWFLLLFYNSRLLIGAQKKFFPFLPNLQ